MTAPLHFYICPLTSPSLILVSNISVTSVDTVTPWEKNLLWIHTQYVRFLIIKVNVHFIFNIHQRNLHMPTFCCVSAVCPGRLLVSSAYSLQISLSPTTWQNMQPSVFNCHNDIIWSFIPAVIAIPLRWSFQTAPSKLACGDWKDSPGHPCSPLYSPWLELSTPEI